MIYRNFQGKQLSGLGMGAMRLPTVNGNDAEIDENATIEMTKYAFEHGVNYFDTAWGYHNGNSELVMGKALASFPRDKFYLATKFPGYDLSNMPKVKGIFEKQLQKLGVSYFDFYLFHNVCELNIEAYLNPKFGIHEYLMEQKKNGRIKHLGFSAHGSVEVMKRFIDAYGKDMEFCQIQLNWLDWNFQGAKEKVALLNEHHIPIWVMEPLRGGRLTKLSPKDEAQLKLLRPEANIASWAFRFLQSIPGVTMILSGMSNLAQMKDNIATFEKDLPLNKTEINTLFHIADGMLGNSLPCTSCHYCVSHCPQGIDIPKMISLYNEHSFSGGGFLAPMTIMALPDNKKPAACRHCHSCEKVCPQGIKISEAMTVLAEKAHL